MNPIATCPCCSGNMLRHISNHRDYWFCRQCWSEMPDLDAIEQKSHPFLRTRQQRRMNLSTNLNKAMPI